MYLPKHFESTDTERALKLMRDYPLATVVSVDDNHTPFVSHLPLTVQHRDGRVVLEGHLSRASPHWTLLADREATAIFHGPNVYITPKWYARNDVPTWNYAVVHARGPVALIEDRIGVERALRTLTATVEHGAEKWEFQIPDDLIETGIEKAIVAFQLTVSALSAKFKLSQNRSEMDRVSVREGLRERGDADSLGVLALMEMEEQR